MEYKIKLINVFIIIVNFVPTYIYNYINIGITINIFS